MKCAGKKMSRGQGRKIGLTADALIKLVRVLLSDGRTFPATTSSEPLKYLSK